MEATGHTRVDSRPRVVQTIERGERHRDLALRYAPDDLDVVVVSRASPDQLRSALLGARYLITEGRRPIGEDIIRDATSLEMIVRVGSFTFDIDVEAARRAGVIVCRWPDAGAIRVAEHVVLQVLALIRRLGESLRRIVQRPEAKSRRTDENTFSFNWSGMDGVESLAGKTVGILGFGEIGAEVSARLRSWGCTLIYHKRSRLPDSVESEMGISYLSRERVVAESDVLVSLLPYSSETDNCIGRETFALMKPGAYVVSSGSGATVDEIAAAEAVASGRLGGLAMDTYEWEPLPASSPLTDLMRAGHNVVLTPHIAGGSKEEVADSRRRIYTEVLHHMAGMPLQTRLM